MSGRIVVIQGGQYGSEGKGQVASEIARREGIPIAVRTGSINAGHTVHLPDGRPFVMQIIPTAWVVPGVQLVLGAGCYIEPDLLEREVEMIRAATGEDVRQRLTIDHRCPWFGDTEAKRAKDANRHHAMGATGKGCSEAIVSKIYDRGDPAKAEARLFKNTARAAGYHFADTVRWLNGERRAGSDILLEGTQGALLDFHTGPYPFVTSRATSSAAWCAEAGLPPVNVDTVLVLRSHPIRVAGNSGPMPGETTWPDLARRMNRRLKDHGKPEVVPEWAIAEFEKVLRQTIEAHFPATALALGARAARLNTWTEEERKLHRVALSESNAITLKMLPDSTLEALRFFEKTTVTKKLRRIADFTVSEAQYAAMMNEPKRLVYTFLNYDYPELANQTALHADARAHMLELSRVLDCPVEYVTTGPLPEHMLKF